MNQQVVQMVNSIIHEQFEVPQNLLLPEAHLKNDLSLDSLDFVDMVVLLESRLNSQLPNIDFMAIKTLQDVYKLVDNLTQNPSTQSQLRPVEAQVELV